jgi:hypothetical protein
MPSWLVWLITRGRAVWGRVKWRVIWDAAVWLVKHGRDRIRENLSRAEQQRFWELIKKAMAGKSKARPWRNLTGKEQEELRALIRKAISGDG